ncbi:MAG: Crp/Fnr family transcriptional regulator [Spirochaetia bacterium]|jgi:CRP-like cAMP-binding protein|nr:Crp/Fnr family transcriptional regulator [Spirochaetia bacterium]
MNNTELNILAESELFKGLDLLEIRSVLDEYSLNKVDFIKGEIVALQGDLYKELLIVLHGTVISEISDPTGKRIRLENFHESAVIAPGILFSIDNTLPVTITAVGFCTLLSIPKEAVLSVLMSKRICLENYLALVGNKVNILAEKIRLFKFSSIQQKIAGYLLNLRSKQKSDFLNIPYTREQLADSFGIARPSLSREFSRMAGAGIILVEGKKIRLLKTTALKYLLNGEILD